MNPEMIYDPDRKAQLTEDEMLGEQTPPPPPMRPKALSLPTSPSRSNLREERVKQSSGSLSSGNTSDKQVNIYASSPASLPDPNMIENSKGDKFDMREGLLYRRPSYEAEGQNELSRSRHRLRGATLPALLRRLTSLEVSTKDDSWSFLCRARALLSPVHFLAFVAARFFLDTYRPSSRCHPYNILKKHKHGVTHKSGRRELLHMINIHPYSKAPKGTSGEKLWLLKTRHVLGPEWELKGRSEEEWQHAVLLPIRCAVLSLLDVYLKHWGFDFNNSVAGGSVGKEDEGLRTEAAGALRNFLVDVADCGSLSLWGWNNDTIYHNPEKDCPGLFVQFPALSGAICAAVAADKKAKSESNKLKLTLSQVKQLRRTLKRNPTFIGRATSTNSDDDSFAFDSFQSNSAKASALAISEKAIVCLAKQATCVIASEHKLSTEAFDSCSEPQPKLLKNAVDKIILATAMLEARNSMDSDGGSSRSLRADSDDKSSTSTCYGNSLALPTSRPNSAAIIRSSDDNSRQVSIASTTSSDSVLTHLTTASAPTLATNLPTPKGGAQQELEISGPIQGPLPTPTSDQRPISTSSQSSVASTLSNATRVVSSKIRRTSLLANMIGSVGKQKSTKEQGFRLFTPHQVAQQVTLHLHYLYCTIPLRELTLDLSFKHSKDSTDMYGQPHLARLRNESERLPSVFISSILERKHPTSRGKLIAFLVEVSQNLYEMRSFHGMMLVLSALQSNPIHRLKKSWAVAYTMSYERFKGESGVCEWDGMDRDNLEPSDFEQVAVKEGYSDLLETSGIGGRNLPHVAHSVLSKITKNHASNPNDTRIAFPDQPNLPAMPFLNSNLGTLIRLNELPDEEKFEIDGGDGNSMEPSTRARSASKSKLQKKRREENRILNLSKMRRVAAIFAMLRMSQLTPYEFDPSPNVQYFIQKNMLFMEGEEQYQQSLLCEPREGF